MCTSGLRAKKHAIYHYIIIDNNLSFKCHFYVLGKQYDIKNLTVIDSLEDYTMKYVVRKLNE